jgi:hypothetical protein
MKKKPLRITSVAKVRERLQVLTTRCSDCQASTVKGGPTAISELSCLVDQLVKRWVDVVCKLDLCYCCKTLGGGTYAKPHNTL